MLRGDAFGLSDTFAGLDNFIDIFTDDAYLHSIRVTVIFSFSVAGLAMSIALLLAVMADRVIKGATAYKTLIIWPYAVAPVVAGVLWFFLFNPTVGLVVMVLRVAGVPLGPRAERKPGHDPGDHCRRLEGDLVQFSLFPGRAASRSRSL